MSAAIDTRTQERYHNPQQDVAQPRFAPTPSGSRQAWCVVASKPKAERRAHAALHHFGFNAYLPLITVRLPNRHYRTQPLWPGYLFVQLDLARPWSPVKSCPGVFHLISVDGIPSTCPEGAVEAIQEAVEAAEASAALNYRPPSQWAPGTLCVVANAIFDAAPAIVLKVGKDTALVSMMWFGHLREALVQLDHLVLREA